MTMDSVLAGAQPWHIETGDCLEVLRALPDGCVQTVITSPPYFGLRDYGVEGQIGLEESPEAFIDRLVAVFREVRRVLRDDGTAWVNMGDSYSGSGVNDGTKSPGLSKAAQRAGPAARPGNTKRWSCPMKPKDLMGMPWRLALALQSDGWWLRADIIWAKPNPMPESVLDRPTKAHEYVFLLSKSEKYFYDADAIREPIQAPQANTDDDLARAFSRRRATVSEVRQGPLEGAHGTMGHDGNGMRMPEKWSNPLGRNKRTVWEVATEPFPGAHFATYPTKLVEPCVLAGSRPGDLVLDIFNGAGTTGLVAVRHGRRYLGIELNPDYAAMARKRIAEDQPGADREVKPGVLQLGLFSGGAE